MKDFELVEFVEESNRIEGILRPPTSKELFAHKHFLDEYRLTVETLSKFVFVVANAQLRDRSGMDVRVGNHRPPPGGPRIPKQLELLLESANDGHNPWEVHLEYETLHPYMDGNGRSGRALWLWQMTRLAQYQPTLKFLHRFYYQTLSGARR